MKKFHTILVIIIALGTIVGTGWTFYCSKVDRAEYMEYIAMNDTKWLESYRQSINQRIWDIQRQKPTTWQTDPEYLRLKSELDLVNMKINAYYQNKMKKGK